MKKLSYIIMGLATLAMTTFALASCDNDNEYTPAEEVAADCPTVYFSNTNESEIFITQSSEKSITLKVERKNTTGAITVPIVVTSKNGSFNIPEYVSFSDGEAETELTVTYDEFESGMNFTIALADDYVNPYLIVAGSTTFKTTLIELSKVCDVTYASDTRFANVTGSCIYAYSGSNKFLWVNFLGSGVDLIFSVDTSNASGAKFDANDFTYLYGDIIPQNYYAKDDYGYHFVKEKDSEDYVTWTPEGASEAVTSFYFYGYYGGSSYSYIDFGYGGDGYDGYGYFWSSYVNDANYENIYFYLHF